MTAEQPSVEALVERVRRGMFRRADVSVPDALDALTELAAALERAERETKHVEAEWADCVRDFQAAEARAQKAEAALRIIATQTYPATYSHTDENGTQHYGKYEDAAQFARSVLDKPPTE